MPKITIEPAHREIHCEAGDNLFESLQKNEVAVDTACVGKGTCGLCRVKITDGENNLNPTGPLDEKHLGNVYFVTKVRLACQTIVQGDVTIEPQLKRKKYKT